MTDSDLLQPSEVARRLDISASTLRRWSAEFSGFLSNGAGRPEPSFQGEAGHRRYTTGDVQVLATVGDMLKQGLTYRQIEGHLSQDRSSSDSSGSESTAVVPAGTSHRALNPAFTIITDALGTLREGQQSVLNSQQANRDLLGVVIQDNFNLKEDNARLRDRMLRLERDVSELQRRNEQLRSEISERMGEVEGQNRSKPAGCLARLFGIG